jgi:predicted RNA-binding protein with PIN domain
MPYWFDGNNLIGQSAAAAQADSQTRRTFLAMLSSYRKSGGGRFTVYFDGDDPDRTAAPPGVSVRYSAPLSADEVLVRRLRETRLPSEVIVVTNDRDLARRCRDAGASTMTWPQFVSKMRARSARHGKGGTHQEQVDVEDWIRYFGLDKSDT